MANLRRTGSGFGNPALVLLVGVVVLEGTWVTCRHGLWDAPPSEAAPGSRSRPAGEGGEENYGAPVWSVAFSADGRYFAWSVLSGEVWLKDRSTAEISRLQEGPMSSARALAFSPDGRVLAVAGGGPRIRLWETATRSELDALEVGGEVTKSIAFAADGITVAVGQESDGDDRAAVTIWDFADRRRLAELAGHNAGVSALVFSPDGALLASGDARGIAKLWDVGVRRERATLRAGDCCIMAVAFSADGRALASCQLGGTVVRFWDAASGQPHGELAAPEGAHTLAFSPDGKWFALGQSEGIATLWDRELRRKLGLVRTGGGRIRSMAFSNDGEQLATGDEAGGLRLWEVRAGVADGLDAAG
jgi:WD40 repeat protein